tara:strand:- start:417 stop:668 length:252 start_codon:yes stop_codon:yes gene_type:complete
MSKYINEILKDLNDNPTSFKDYHGQGVVKGNIRISQFGNTRMLSIIKVCLNDKDIPTSYIDLWRMETAIKKWYRTVSLKVLMA